MNIEQFKVYQESMNVGKGKEWDKTDGIKGSKKLFNDFLLKNKFYKIENLSQKENEWIEKYYEENILPLIAPTTLDPAHPFPFIQNQGKGLFIEMSYRKNKEINSVILLPKNLNRFVRLPGEEHKYIFLEVSSEK